MADRVGDQFGDYRLLRLLGEGTFGEVYLGEHIYLGTQAAIKVLHARLAEDELKGFLEEARKIATLNHAHIVRLLGFSMLNRVPYLVMQLAPGGTLLKRHPRKTRLPLATILPYVRQCAEALQYAHDRSLIHLDLKPENLLLGEQGDLLLADFGISKVLQQGRTHVSVAGFAGSPGYAAYDKDMAQRLFEYGSSAMRIHQRPIASVVLWLQSGGMVPTPPYRVQWGDLWIMDWNFTNIRVHDFSASATISSGPLGLLPLMPFMGGADEQLSEQAMRRLKEEAPGDQ